MSGRKTKKPAQSAGFFVNCGTAYFFLAAFFVDFFAAFFVAFLALFFFIGMCQLSRTGG